MQFHSYGGRSWKDICSRAELIARAVNNRPQIVMDMGQVMFGKTTTMTADGPMEFNLYRLHHNKWSNHDVELETGSGIIPVYYNRKNVVNSVMWAIGLELALCTKNPWQCLLATDNPNGGPFVKYPEIIALLMSKRYRDAEFATVHPETSRRVILPSLDREMGWNEIAVMTRAGQARALGIRSLGKGHLGIGAEADVAIYPIDPRTLDPARDWEKVVQGFGQTRYTVKRGRVVARDGEILVEGESGTIWVKPSVPPDFDMATDPEFTRMFNRYYTVRMANYPVQDSYVKRSIPILTTGAL
jgi:formylmethanofuran dehydrogenase subunit A